MLTPEQVKDIKGLLAENQLTQPEIAKEFGVSRSLISNIATGRAYKKIDGPDIPVKSGKGQRKLFNPDQRILELQADNEHLRAERNQARNQLKAAAKTQGLFQAVADEMEAIVKPFKSLPKARVIKAVKKADVIEHLVLHLSDAHHDQIVTPDECSGLECHDFSTSICRAERLVDTTLKWTQETLAPRFYFPDLTILAYGDFTSGEIHGHMNRSYFRNMFKNCLAIGQLHALIYRDLAPYFNSVNVLYVPGNHGRRSLKKNYHGANDNWDYLIGKTAQLYCQDLENIDFAIPDAFTVNIDINGFGFCITHGDDIRSSLGIPYYGIQRRQQRLIGLSRIQSGPPIKYFVCGHFHKFSTLTEVDTEILMNGSWLATDAYAYNTLASCVEPMQLLHGVHHRYGVSWRLPIKLRTEQEQYGPKRYKIDLMDEIGI